MTTDPLALFDAWLAEAEGSEPNDPNAMALATVDAGGQPSVRMVLLKGRDQGFVFYTNGESRKADQLAATGRAALMFHWKSLRKQVRVEGAVGPVDDALADAYFATRSRESQLGAWASEQSRHLPERAHLEARYAEVVARFEGQPVPRPPHWRGYRVTPARLEFWEDGAHRLHNRRLFSMNGSGEWSARLLHP